MAVGDLGLLLDSLCPRGLARAYAGSEKGLPQASRCSKPGNYGPVHNVHPPQPDCGPACYIRTMPNRLHCYYGPGCANFSCYRRLPLLGTARLSCSFACSSRCEAGFSLDGAAHCVRACGPSRRQSRPLRLGSGEAMNGHSSTRRFLRRGLILGEADWHG